MASDSEPVIRRLRDGAFLAGICSVLAACVIAGTQVAGEAPRGTGESALTPVTSSPWVMATASVTDIARTAQFFLEIGGYEKVGEGPIGAAELSAYGLPSGATGQALVLRAPDSVGGLVRLVQFENAGKQEPMRPGSRAWDTGCYWSLMVRANDMESIYSDAVRMGWWTHTPITDLEFGGSVLKVVVFQGPDGLQVQAYERISPPLEGFTPFRRLSQPFNIMQMTADREAARQFTEDVLGFGRFWFGPPYVDEEPTSMPLGIPRNLTTEIPYKAGIFYPVPSEYGRMEYIEIEGLEGQDYSDRCHAPNLGWLSVTYEVEDVQAVKDMIAARGGAITIDAYADDRAGLGKISVFGVNSPDGAIIEFVAKP